MVDPDLMARIRRRAYEIWEAEGRPEGRERIHWLRAEAEFRESLTASRPSRPIPQPKPQKPANPTQRAAGADRGR